ncbi:hypothetical protein FCL47_20290 [Desulfopila sp. IMCC35006]|uniref:hypothetical protein n=1 Tax=Desulfopila sp. IMCC35006 TaxID=2569542 RepID=UPI0010AC4629|nr:hypothetical protein [Desulfopila sp. IMCC35006]TKB24006.1 hypothetical protein FCL47_20290 [Desulfopila sp. IMCC35006]
MQTVVKKWFRDKDSGILDNGSGPDIIVLKADLVNCQFLKVGATVEFECHSGDQRIIAKKVKLAQQFKGTKQKNEQRKPKEFRYGVMT